MNLLDRVIPAALGEVSAVRREFGALVDRLPLTEEEKIDLVTAFGEALANAVRHGSPSCELDRVLIRADRRGGDLVVEITDCGPGFDPAAVRGPDYVNGGGMGLGIIRCAFDRVEWVRGDTGHTVRLTKTLRRKTHARTLAAGAHPRPEAALATAR
jgi:anti-sigma regulatory factor (Ser/Thr protein kinase)